MTSPEKLATPETVRKALQRAYSLGQTYWQQADSESFSQNRKADETAAKFQALVEEAVACVLATQRQGEGENRKIAQLIIDNDRAGAVKWATGLIGNFDGPSCRIDPDATSQGVAVAQPDAREAALEQAANLVECEYAADATQGRRLAQIAQHIRDLKKRGV